MGADYRDAGWPGPPDLQAAVTPESGARDALLERLRAAYGTHRVHEKTRV
jgi:hypothetical protein